jgi:hypothetical protein
MRQALIEENEGKGCEMWTSKRVLLVLLIALAIPFAIELKAQEEPAYMYLEPKDKGEEGVERIYTGVVIAYGERIDPPYYVEFKNDTVWINNIPVIPAVRPWHKEQPEVVVTDEDRRRHTLGKSIINDFITYNNTYGEERAISMILEKYLPDTTISEIEFRRKREYVSTIRLKYSDGYLSRLTFSDMRLTDGTIVSFTRKIPSQEILKEREIQATIIRSQLKRGFLRIFGLGYGASIHPGDKKDKLLNALEKIAMGEIVVEQFRESNRGVLPVSPNFWEEFEKKKHTWK